MTLRRATWAPRSWRRPWSCGCCPYKLGSFRDYQMAEVAAYVVAVAGLTVLIGLSGQISHRATARSWPSAPTPPRCC